MDCRALRRTACLCWLLFTSCISLPVTVVEPLGDGPVELAPDEGILVVDFESDVLLSSMVVGGYKVRNHGKLQLIRVDAGRYSWERAEIDRLVARGVMRTTYPLDWVELNEFEVVAGHINYPGRMVIRKWSTDYFNARFINRSAATLPTIRERFPRLSEAWPIRYAGPIRDDFLEELFEAERRAADGREAAP